MYTHIYKTLNCVPTHLIIWGNPFDCNGKDVIVCVSGNPGLTDFYIEFASELFKNTGLPICVVGQAGHEIIPNTSNQCYVLNNQEYLYNLEGQIAHKLDLINNYLDKQSKIHLMGHSIGSWMLIELLNKNIHLLDRVSSINLLFPTIQRMAESPNGKFLTKIVKNIQHILMFLVMFLYILPDWVTTFFIYIYLKCKSLPLLYKEIILKFLNPLVIEKTLFLAFDEMATVTELNKEGIEKLKHKINIICSSRDGWAPLQYMDNLKQFQPPLQMKIVNIDHAFVFKSSERVAVMVTDFINAKM